MLNTQGIIGSLLRGAFALCIAAGSGHVIAAGADLNDMMCGELRNHFGPFDYRTASAFNKRLVETPHFHPQFAAVIAGKRIAEKREVMDDLNYTLRVFPNHPGALMAIDRAGIIYKSERPPKADWTLECYYQRAKRYAPDDGIVYYTYASYLQRRGRVKDSREQLERAVELLETDSRTNGNILYNIGLAWFELREFEKAQDYAERAEREGFNLPGLKAKLQRGGHWKDRPPVDATKSKAELSGGASAGAVPTSPQGNTPTPRKALVDATAGSAPVQPE